MISHAGWPPRLLDPLFDRDMRCPARACRQTLSSILKSPNPRDVSMYPSVPLAAITSWEDISHPSASSAATAPPRAPVLRAPRIISYIPTAAPGAAVAGGHAGEPATASSGLAAPHFPPSSARQPAVNDILGQLRSGLGSGPHGTPPPQGTAPLRLCPGVSVRA